MSAHTLSPHPDSICDAITSIDVNVDRSALGLALTYRMTGDIVRLRLPSFQVVRRTDQLWQHTCCELFIAHADTPDYYEFNFSPSGAWAAYHFSEYRTGMRSADVRAPEIKTQATATVLELRVALETQFCVGALGTTQLGLSCVLEEETGRLSYWALAHASGKPDFHYRGGFRVKLDDR